MNKIERDGIYIQRQSPGLLHHDESRGYANIQEIEFILSLEQGDRCYSTSIATLHTVL